MWCATRSGGSGMVSTTLRKFDEAGLTSMIAMPSCRFCPGTGDLNAFRSSKDLLSELSIARISTLVAEGNAKTAVTVAAIMMRFIAGSRILFVHQKYTELVVSSKSEHVPCLVTAADPANSHC